MSTTTRVTRPTATRPRSSFTDTVKVTRRPSTFSTVASAVTVWPTAVGARWSSCTLHAHRRLAGPSSPSDCRTAASSQSAMTRGVASTGTSPDRRAMAVSASVTGQIDARRLARLHGHRGTITPLIDLWASHAGSGGVTTARRQRCVASTVALGTVPVRRTASEVTLGEDHDQKRRPDRGRRDRPGARHRPPDRRRLRRGLRRGQAIVVGVARRRQGRGAHLRSRPGRRDPGRRRATPPDSPTPPTCPSRACSPRPRPRPRPLAAGAAGRRPWRSTRRSADRGLRRRDLPERRGQGQPRSSCSPGRRGRSRRGRGHHPGVGAATATAAAASWWPTPTACSPATTRSARCFAVSCVATGDTGMQTGRETIGHTVGFELFDMYDVEDLAARAADAPSPSSRPARRRAGRCPW